jgi:hypothetical protein
VTKGAGIIVLLDQNSSLSTMSDESRALVFLSQSYKNLMSMLLTSVNIANENIGSVELLWNLFVCIVVSGRYGVRAQALIFTLAKFF